MKFIETPLPGAFEIELEKRGDERGFFARSFCSKEFEEHGINNRIVQINNSLSEQKGTLRGMHFQLSPYSESKTIRCIRGAIYDVILDMRPNSDTFGNWYGVELTSENRKLLHVPEEFAHGFITLQDDTEVLYFVSEYYYPELERGIRWNDPWAGINWPLDPQEISEKDKNHPNFTLEIFKK